MNTNHSNYTGRMHRTLESAFGPYAGGPIQEPIEPYDAADKIVVTISVLIAAALVAFAWLGWF